MMEIVNVYCALAGQHQALICKYDLSCRIIFTYLYLNATSSQCAFCKQVVLLNTYQSIDAFSALTLLVGW